MSEWRSALPGAAFDGAVRVEEIGLKGMITLKGDLASETLRATARDAGGTDVPPPLGAGFAGERGLLWMAPDELLILLPHAEAAGTARALADALAGEHALVADVSDARALFRVAGDGAAETLQKLTPADLRPSVFGPGMVRRTRLAQVPAALWMQEPGEVRVIAFRSVARYVFDLMANAARPGAEVGYF